MVPGFTRTVTTAHRELPSGRSVAAASVDGLNEAQRTAVTTPADVVQILAPPGSGKTRTLTSRVAYLLSEPLCLSPQNVIVATFTVKAANEMKERLSKLVGESVGRRLLLGTFHSICRRYLVKYGHLIGLRQGWGIADSGDSKAICKRIIKRRGLGESVDPKQLQSRISHFKARNMEPMTNAYPTVQSTNPAASTQKSTQARQKDIATEDFVLLYEDYHAQLESSNLLDYDDLLVRCLELLRENPECVSNIEALLIDEFQDTNVVQYELMRKFSWKYQRITVVGDPDQSIYGFRAAEIGNVRRMQRQYPDTLVVNLEENYRSSASILQAALVVIQQDGNRIDKALTATHPIGPSPVLRRVASAAAEAEWIVGEIKRLRAVTAGMIPLDGVAILVRSAHLTRHVETVLTRQGMAYKMVGGTRFFDRAEVKIVVEYLRVLQNPANNDAVVRIINVPSRKVGDTTVKGLLEDAEKKKKSLWDSVYRGVCGHSPWGTKVAKLAEKGMESFVGLMTKVMEKLDDPETTLADLVENLLAKLNYAAYIHNHYPEDFDSRWANVQELIAQAREIRLDEDDEALPDIDGLQQQVGPRKTPRAALERFLANAALVNERQRRLAGPDEKVAEIMISTIHAAKGLEWPVVFVPSVYEGSIPHLRAEDVDEERRLLYVAMTRAQALLYLSCPFRSGEKVKLSSFIDKPNIKNRLMSNKASDLSFSNVQTLAQILSARCPTEIEIEAVVESSGIQSRCDDVISDKDPDDKEENEKRAVRENNNYRENGNYRSKPDVPQFQSARAWTNISTTTTEDRIRHKATTENKIGFRSAGSHLSELKKQGVDFACEADKDLNVRRTSDARMMQNSTVSTNRAVSITIIDTCTTTTTKKGKPVASKSSRPAGQGTLMGFLTKKPPPPKPATATSAVRTIAPDVSLLEQVQSLPAPVIPKRAGGDFILLSSSPPRKVKKRRTKPETTKMKHVQPEEQEDDQEIPPSSPVFGAFCEDMQQHEPPPPPPPPFPQAIAFEIDMEDIREEATLPKLVQETSMLPPKIPLAGSQRGVKRTLGIRRSMNGWENRQRR